MASYLPPKKLAKFRPFLNPFLTISENVSHPTLPTRVDGVRTELNVALKLSIAANLNKHYISQFSYCYLRRCLSALTCIPFRNHFSFLRLHHLRATKKRLRLDIFCNFLFYGKNEFKVTAVNKVRQLSQVSSINNLLWKLQILPRKTSIEKVNFSRAGSHPSNLTKMSTSTSHFWESELTFCE